jgi:mevalonate pyrophosphate decarboxylase
MKPELEIVKPFDYNARVRTIEETLEDVKQTIKEKEITKIIIIMADSLDNMSIEYAGNGGLERIGMLEVAIKLESDRWG